MVGIAAAREFAGSLQTSVPMSAIGNVATSSSRSVPGSFRNASNVHNRAWSSNFQGSGWRSGAHITSFGWRASHVDGPGNNGNYGSRFGQIDTRMGASHGVQCFNCNRFGHIASSSQYSVQSVDRQGSFSTFPERRAQSGPSESRARQSNDHQAPIVSVSRMEPNTVSVSARTCVNRGVQSDGGHSEIAE